MLKYGGMSAGEHTSKDRLWKCRYFIFVSISILSKETETLELTVQSIAIQSYI